MQFLHETRPDGRWWLKADGTDIQEGLRESMRNEWSGDVDLGDGKLQGKYSKCVEYLKFVRGIGVNDRSSSVNFKEDLLKQTANLAVEKECLEKGHADAQKDYKKVQELPSAPEKSLFAIAWKVEEYKSLLEKNASLAQSMKNIISIIESGKTQAVNIGTAISTVRKELLDYVKGIKKYLVLFICIVFCPMVYMYVLCTIMLIRYYNKD